MFKTKKQKLVIYSLFMGLFLYLGIGIIQLYQKNKKEYYLSVQSELLQVKYATSYKYFKVMADDIALMYNNNNKVTRLLSLIAKADKSQRAKIRKNLYKTLFKNYKRLNNMGITQVHFHLPNNISFLRMYNPRVFGDDISNIKDAVVLTNKTKTPHNGFESCSFMAGLRFVYPMYNANHRYLGCVEIAYSSEEILKYVSDDFVHDSHVLISKKIVDGTIVQKMMNVDYKQSWEHSDYLVEESTHKHIGNKNLYAKLNTDDVHEKIIKGVSSKKVFSIVTDYNYQNIIMSFLPLANTTDTENIAYVVTYTESDYLSNLRIEYNYILALFITTLTLLYLFGFYAILSQIKMKKLALYDNLTELPNRTLFNIEFTNELNRALRYNNNIALLFLDLDGFKIVNDTYGHQVGDELLIEVANRITSCLRQNDIVSRLGGDEFTMILSDIENAQKAVEIAQKIIKEINKEIIIQHEIIHVGASVGISMYPEHFHKIDDLINSADKMMYISKENGKNQVTLYKESLNV